MNSNSNQSFFSKLMERRFFQYLGSYLLGSWALVQFIDWMAERYGLHAQWSEITLLFLVLFIPSAIIIIYFHGQTGTQTWSRFEKIFIPINILIAAFLSFNFSPQNEALTAQINTPEKITLQDEEGNEVIRLVPQSSQTRRIVFFPFANDDKSSTDNWEAIGFPKLLSSDLEQDNRLYGISPLSLDEEYKEYGFELGKPTPFSILRKIADDYYADIFFTGSYKKEKDTYTLNLEAFSTRDGKSFFTIQKKGDDFFTLIDDITEAFKKNLVLPDVEADIPLVDLPASNLYSENIDAYKKYIKACASNNFENNHEAAVELMQEAIEIDQNCVECLSQNGYFLLRGNKPEEAFKAYEKAMQRIEVLPERQQLNIKYWNYFALGQVEKTIALTKMWSEFYPNDYKPYSYLIDTYRRRAEFDKAREVCNTAISRGHKGTMLLKMARISTGQGDFKSAKDYYKQFEETYPHRAKETKGLADIYIKEGDFDKARKHLENLQVLKSNDKSIPQALAQVEFLRGDIQKAIFHMDEALSLCKYPKDSVSAYAQLESFYIQLGKIDKSIDLKYKRMAIQKSYSSSFEIDSEFLQFPVIDQYLKAGRRAEIEAKIQPFMESEDQSIPGLACAAKINFYLAVREKAKAQKAEAECHDFAIQAQGAITYLIVDAFMYDLNDEHAKAAEAIEKFNEATKFNDPYINTYLVRFYRKSNQFEKAKVMAKNLLDQTPVLPELTYELALTHLAEGDKTKAREYLQQSLDLWKDADDNFKPAQEARATLAGLE